MNTKPMLAIAIAALVSSTIPGLAQSSRAGCAYGSITVERLAAGECTASIPLPTPRPAVGSANADDNRHDRLVAKVYDHIKTANPQTGKMRDVRVVGPRYLASDDSSIQLRHDASLMSDPINAVFDGVANLAGIGPGAPERDVASAETAKPAKSDLPPKAVLEARADLRINAAHN